MTKRKTPAKRERGGTFLGVVLGLMVGLAIALGVAIYVTKVPVPFIHNGQVRSGEQDAAEARKNKDWDPNVLIQGKNPVKPVVPASDADAATSETKPDTKFDTKPETKAKPEPKPEAKAETKPEPKSEQKPEPKPEVKAKPEPKPEAKPEPKPEVKAKPAGDPLGDLLKSKAPDTSSSDPFLYQVQTGAFRAPEDADAQRVKLALIGVDVKVTEREQSGRTVYRVRSGPFGQKEDAEKTKDKLLSAGFDAVLVRIPR